jgi:acyl-coenzyme A thioesterase PaaI-like protein
MESLPQTQSCFACGHSNPLGLNLAFRQDGDSILTTWVPVEHQTGFSNTIHGGLIATVLDEIMAWTCGVLGGRFAYSVDLQIRYSQPLQPGQEVTGIGFLNENRRKKIFNTGAKLMVGDTEIASATGKYLAVKASVEDRLWPEFGEQAAALQALRAKNDKDEQNQKD